MDSILEQFKLSAEKTLIYLKEDFKSIRTGKSNPALVENILVETYAGQSKLKLLELATTATEGATALLITPFDPSTLVDIERAILKSSLGLTTSVQGNQIKVIIPPLSQEQREKLLKLVNQKTEERKNFIRNYRDEARKKIKQLYEAKNLTQDDKFRLEKEIDSEIQKYMEQLQQIRTNKEKEIMQI
ncbi:hypothetical protein A3C98_01515 [Candidatus Roizmanbacteria bacterium RIFCSPHIGHO2_02_FULL_37_15]|uniref:Ribosome recycling factor domain-containing protein n=1 Tax=Candidatus Roizmanbacteria bacterium RIFCSPLOWO2_01_FULL_37_16 TaxID=1802058 RepID=A0A1F7IQJ2_9BACT|nr:MAG: hypothetical protein A2859_00420 [Candidatus Roizmanbacteria bacterium RIFCSPHIGHO2_01_FULL_37_16b]OGK21152.1 MAG: hypothetical protein A3C98_01515 [Candidatus Roizmanbacteria bacterium RIFCSPHIGHO2_02_FULL_37_15]OGK32740.1 MAG: hypothetical protein A3F57_02080 [Candidatus Roizmanbacteria bacterium RIFCSPHIGHO2_12_FULL_36_11]OGK45630.1 MAG: hypothetical protein A3B40_00355 [Candidatus Roizmanbacteria bacterium RIFCSPLOWO2_01_FULL_37_16]OGK56636.1 MAG: hypothetical protein A3I50_01190 [C